MSTDFKANQAHTEITTTGPLVIEVKTPEFAQARKKAEDAYERFLDSGSKILNKLDAEVQVMTIASRFSSTKLMTLNALREGEKDQIEVLYPNLTEDEYKRKQLLDDLSKIRQEHLALAMRLTTLVMDIEATKTEG